MSGIPENISDSVLEAQDFSASDSLSPTSDPPELKSDLKALEEWKQGAMIWEENNTHVITELQATRIEPRDN